MAKKTSSTVKVNRESIIAGRLKSVEIRVDSIPAMKVSAVDPAEDALSTQSTAPATFLEDEELTHLSDNTHGKEGSFLHQDDDDDHTDTGEEEKEAEFFRDLGDLNRASARLLGRSGSILKVKSQEFHIKDTKRSWKQLPKPDLQYIRSISLPVTEQERVTLAEKKSVKFDAIHFRNYSQTLGDNPSCSYGPPISLDWSYEEGGEVELDEYERERPPRRKLRQMMLVSIFCGNGGWLIPNAWLLRS